MIDWLISGGWIVVCCVCGMAMVFQEPLPRKSRPTTTPKRAKPNAKQAKRTNRKSRKVQTKKQKKEKAKGWYVAPPLTPEQQIWYAKYRERDFVRANPD